MHRAEDGLPSSAHPTKLVGWVEERNPASQTLETAGDRHRRGRWVSCVNPAYGLLRAHGFPPQSRGFRRHAQGFFPCAPRSKPRAQGFYRCAPRAAPCAAGLAGGDFEEHPLLRIHRSGLARGNAEERGVEAVDVGQEGAARGHDPALCGPVGIVERRRVELTQTELREQARAKLREARYDNAFSEWAKEVRGNAFVEMREPPQ